MTEYGDYTYSGVSTYRSDYNLVIRATIAYQNSMDDKFFDEVKKEVFDAIQKSILSDDQKTFNSPYKIQQKAMQIALDKVKGIKSQF